MSHILRHGPGRVPWHKDLKCKGCKSLVRYWRTDCWREEPTDNRLYTRCPECGTEAFVGHFPA